MDFKTIVSRTMREAGIPNAAFEATGVSGATGEALRVVGWVEAAYADVQSRRKWNWLWESAAVTVPSGDYVVAAATVGAVPAARYEKGSLHDATGAFFAYRPWEVFRVSFPAPLIQAGTPSLWTIRPDGAFVVNSRPTADITYTLERYARPDVMANDTDEPVIPTEFQMVLVWRALLLYCNFEEAGVSRATALAEHDRIMNAMGIQDLPDMLEAPPLC